MLVYQHYRHKYLEIDWPYACFYVIHYVNRDGMLLYNHLMCLYLICWISKLDSLELLYTMSKEPDKEEDKEESHEQDAPE